MVKVLVAYDTKYGNTQRVAELIGEGLKEAGVEASVENMKQIDFEKAEEFDAILMGAPNHFGSATRTFKKFVDKLRKTNLQGKSVAVFDTYLGDDFEKALKKMEKDLQKKLPGTKLLSPGLSIEVREMKGPIIEKELPKCSKFGQKIASQL